MSKELSTVKSLFSQVNVKKRFEELLGQKAPGFISSILQIVGNNNLLSKADPGTVLNAAATAASLDLPINQNLGFAWIVPYKGQAQFQMGAKGYVQLALRTGQYQRINVACVYENQFKSFNALSEQLDADFNTIGEGKIVGYAAYFKLNNGFEKLVYWSTEKVLAHAKKYSKSFNSSHSPWQDKDQFDAMAKKTVLKNMISRWGIMSIEIQTAIVADQAVQIEEGQYEYIDNDNRDDNGNTITGSKNSDLVALIQNAKSNEELLMIHDNHKAEISKDINLVSLLGKKKKEFDVPDVDKNKIKELIEESESLDDLESIASEYGGVINSDKKLNRSFIDTQKSLSDE